MKIDSSRADLPMLLFPPTIVTRARSLIVKSLKQLKLRIVKIFFANSNKKSKQPPLQVSTLRNNLSYSEISTIALELVELRLSN